MATNQKSVDIIEGEVTQAYVPSKNDKGSWRPANIYIETAEGKIKLSQFPASDFDTHITHEPIQMPAWYTALDLGNLVGAKVQVVAEYKSTWDDTREYHKATAFKVLSSLPTPQPSESPTTAPTTASWSGSLDERIAWNSAINNAVTAIPWISNMAEDKEAYYTPNWLSEVDTLARDVYALIRRGPTPPAENALEQPIEAQEPNVEPEPDIEHPGEDDIASNMGVFEA